MFRFRSGTQGDPAVKPLFLLIIMLGLVACNKDPAKVTEDVAKAMGAVEFEDAEENLRWLLERSPKDAKLQANLAFALTSQGKDQEALPLYEALIAGGDGSYDLFAYYARTLDAVGRPDDAITWNYRALAVVPQLVDVRRDLAKILVKQDRAFEALSLLASFDDELQEKGKPAFFEAQRIAIASGLPAAVTTPDGGPLKSVRIGGHFYAIVLGGNGEALPFMIDTGASHTTLSHEALAMLGLRIPPSSKSVRMSAADGYIVTGRQFNVPTFQVGPYVLESLPIVVCDNCASLLGQSALERFDLETRKADGLEFLTMSMREAKGE